VIGVSESEDNLRKNIVSNLVRFGFQGETHPVGPRGGEMLGRAIHRSVAEVPKPVDPAVILTPARVVSEVLTQCGEKGIRRVIVQTGGFRELGSEGRELERQLIEVSTRFGIRFLGPNCIGAIRVQTGFYAPFVALPTPYRPGKVSVFAQSGNVGLTLGERISSAGIGVSKLVSMGNKLNLDEVDSPKFLLNDPETEIIFFYLEDIKRGQNMVFSSRELIIGGKRDSSIGPVVLTGLGGIMVEVLKDVSMRLAPVGTEAARSRLRELSGARILGPFRGMPEADVEAAARILVRLSLLMHRLPEIAELDLNPVALSDDGYGALALDARLLLRL